jgi:quinol monooxygenase YgiN
VGGETTIFAAAAVPRVPCQVVELRRYALRPAQRDTLIDLFDREFVETQEAAGMCILGQFRDLDDPDSFVWLRGFADMETRREALESFYGGPVWKRHARAANATMLRSDDVLLLRPIRGLEYDPSRRAARGSNVTPSGLLAITIWRLAQGAAAELPALFRRHLEPALAAAGVVVLATYVTEHSENTFPGLPVRENEEFFVWISLYEDEEAHARRVDALERSARWGEAGQVLAPHLSDAPQTLRLRPTARSAIHV